MNLSRAPIERYESLRAKLGEGWIVIFDRVAPPRVPERGATLTLGAPGPGAVEKPTVVDWDRDAPPNHRIDYGGLLVRRSRILGGDPLVRAIEGPVATWSASLCGASSSAASISRTISSYPRSSLTDRTIQSRHRQIWP